RGHKDTGITLLQKVAQLKARHEVYDTHANMPHPAVNQHTFIAASMVPKPTPFEGRPENRASFVIYSSHFLGLTLTPQTPPSVKVRIGVYLGNELCRWFSEFTAAQPHLLEDYDAFLHAVTRNYTGYDLDLEARHAYHNMRQSEIQDTMLSTQQWRQATTALPRNFEEFDRVEACLIDDVMRVQVHCEEECPAEQQRRPSHVMNDPLNTDSEGELLVVLRRPVEIGRSNIASSSRKISNEAQEVVDDVKRVQVQCEEEGLAEQQRRPAHISSFAARQNQGTHRGATIGNSTPPRTDNAQRHDVQHPLCGDNTRSSDGASSPSMDVDPASTEVPSDKGQHRPEYATLERLLQLLYHRGNITASWEALSSRVRRQKFDVTSGRTKYYELKTSDQDYDAALLKAAWKFSNQ
ncbi:hypothetical protein RI367_007818, partial [Sorochytrium milnesiophthora]